MRNISRRTFFQGTATAGAAARVKGGNTIGNLFLGADGWMHCSGAGFKVYKGDSSQLVMDEKGVGDDNSTVLHMRNFLAACRSRDHRQLNADIEIGAMSATLCHLANISYRVGRKLQLDAAGRFVNGPAANALATRDYRKPYVV